MKSSLLKRIAWGVLLSLAVSVATPSAALAGPPEPVAPETHEGITGKLALKLYKGLARGFHKVLERANRSDRINLAMVFTHIDAQERMIFDFAGTVRVRIPSERLRERLLEEMEDGRTRVLSSNGPLSLDVAISPLRADGEEFVFAVQIDLIVLTHTLFGQLAANAAQVVGMIGLNALAGQAAEALGLVDWDVGGKALEMGVSYLPAMLAGEAGAISYATFQDEQHQKLREKLRATATPRGLLKHFVLALCFAGTTTGMRVVGGSVGAAVGAALIPGGSTFLGTVLATSTLVWFGNWAVTWVAIKLPVLWKLARIGRLYRKACEAEGSRQERLSRKLGEYRQDVVDRAVEELTRGYKRWHFLNMTIAYFRKRVKKGDPSMSPLEAFDVYPYQPLVDGICQRLRFMTLQEDNWYAARMYYQLLDAVNQLDRADPAMAPLGVWEQVANR